MPAAAESAFPTWQNAVLGAPCGAAIRNGVLDQIQIFKSDGKSMLISNARITVSGQYEAA